MAAYRVLSQGDTSKDFIDSCREAEIKPTKRQWKKWRNKTGLAFKTKMRRV